MSRLSSNSDDITFIISTLEVTPASFGVSQTTLSSIVFAAASIAVATLALIDADQEGMADLIIHIPSSVAMKEALTEL